MTIRPLGGVQLAGEDAEQFLRQIVQGPPKKAAQEAVKRGDRMLAEFRETGRIVVHLR